MLNPEGCAARASLQRELARVGLPMRVSVETYNYELQLALIARERGLGHVGGRAHVARRDRRLRFFGHGYKPARLMFMVVVITTMATRTMGQAR